MKVVVDVSGQDGYVGDCDFIAVDFDHEYVVAVLQMHRRFLKMKEDQGEAGPLGKMHMLECFDPSPIAFSSGEWLTKQPWWPTNYPDGYVKIPDPEWEPNPNAWERISCTTIHIKETGVCWEFNLKHSDIWLKTSEIPIQQIEEWGDL